MLILLLNSYANYKTKGVPEYTQNNLYVDHQLFNSKHKEIRIGEIMGMSTHIVEFIHRKGYLFACRHIMMQGINRKSYGYPWNIRSSSPNMPCRSIKFIGKQGRLVIERITEY